VLRAVAVNIEFFCDVTLFGFTNIHRNFVSSY